MPSTSTSPTSSTTLPRPRKSLNPGSRIPTTSTVAGSSTATSPLQSSRLSNMQPTASSSDIGNGNPSKSTGNGQSKRVVSALAIQGAAGRKGMRLSAVMPSAPVVSMEVMNTNFEEWMKLATDNKITANNTWNFALIDYFADLTLLRNDEDQSINFQKASCTLDGCVKIWTSRVDSVATETGKLLSGLAGGNSGGGDEDGEEGAEGDDGEEGEGGVVRTRKTASRSESTLAKSFASLQIKKFDLEFTVDPLFKKTSADFDEGGAMGLLMNHLGVDGRGRVVFDAGDAGIEEEEEVLEEDEMVDLTKLREFVPSTEKLDAAVISETLSSFRFSSDPNSLPDFASLLTHPDSPSPSRPTTPLDFSQDNNTYNEPHDFFNDENFDLPPPQGFDDDVEDAGEEGGFGGGIGMALPGEGGLSAFDPSRSKRSELVMALVGDGNGGGGGEEGEVDGGLFGYFDKGFGKSWAGAEHWKLKKVSKKADTQAGPSVPKTTKAPKAAFQIDFASPSTTASSSKKLFVPAPKSTLILPKKSKRERRNDWLLPDDMHFSSRQLLRLFLKPKFALRMRKNASNIARMTEGNSGEVDENFWAAAAAERMDTGDGDAMDPDSQPAPFASQFFHDDPDDADVDDALDLPDSTLNPDPEEADDLWQGTQGTELKRVRPENVHYAKKAKRVDVKRLKDDIWVGLRGLVPEDRVTDLSSSEEEPTPSTPEAEVKVFDSVIQNLRTTYPSEKMSEISTSFCFICLLHLANEEGLRIETDRFDGEAFEEERWEGGGGKDRVVGELQALKVYRDKDAGRGA